MTAGTVLRQMLRERRRSSALWSLALAALVVITAATYPTVKDIGSVLDQLMETMPEGMLDLFGAQDGITSPEGFLNSQLYSNIFPILLLVLGIGVAAWTIAGAEREGTLESLLANPISRSRVALERVIGLTILIAVPTFVATVLLIALRTPFELDEVGVVRFFAVGVGSFLLVLLFATLTYAVGAATGSKAAGIATGAGLATATYVIFGLASFVDFFDNLRWLSPWDWFLNYSPLTDGWTWQAIGAPFIVIVPAIAVGTVLFTRRDLH
jgi:ABC-2 type transport system permease protein